MHETGMFQFIWQAGWFVKGILFLLAVFSVTSWGIILQKVFALRIAATQSRRFLQALDTGLSQDELFAQARKLTASPVANVFRRAVEASPRAPQNLPTLLKRYATIEVERLQSYLAFLATTGSVTPFIGLLGTVWGIMDAFRSIGAAGSASLAVVSPAIAEALITTAAGLVAAIPAVMAYNALLNWVRKMALDLDDFAEMLAEQLSDSSSHETPVRTRLSV